MTASPDKAHDNTIQNTKQLFTNKRHVNNGSHLTMHWPIGLID